MGVSPKLEVAVKGGRALQLCLVEACPAAWDAQVEVHSSSMQTAAPPQVKWVLQQMLGFKCSHCTPLTEAMWCSRRTPLVVQQAGASI